MIEDELTGRILKVFYRVYNTLGFGFIESVYHNAMILELVEHGCNVETEKPIAVTYHEHIVGTFAPDLVIDGRVILELKAKEKIVEAHEVQLVNYLRATDIEIGLLLNFGRSPEFKRKYFSNEHKKRRTSTSLFSDLLISDPS
jgi:GxxExxY protein